MPADSDSPALPVRWRPLGVRMVGITVALGLIVICTVSWLGLEDSTKAGMSVLEKATLLALGGGILAVVHALVRSRAVASSGGLEVVNGYRRRTFAWAQIVGVRMPPGAPWVTLDLADGETASVMAIQGSDGARATRAVRELRVIVARESAAAPD
jgi:hypothetical protein